MKCALLLLALLFPLAVTRADLVIEIKIESAAQNGNMTMKVKGDKVRTDMPTGPAGAMSAITDLTTGDSVTLLHGQKMTMKVSGAQAKQMAELMKKQVTAPGGAAAAQSSKPQATGKTEKVGDFNTEIYTLAHPSGTYTFWVAKDFADYFKIKSELDKLNKASATGFGQGMGPDYGALPGMAVKTVAEMAGQKVTSTVLSVKQQLVDAGLFEAPADYQPMAQPALPSAPAPK